MANGLSQRSEGLPLHWGLGLVLLKPLTWWAGSSVTRLGRSAVGRKRDAFL